ncbi:MAG: hypothetical protein RLZZ401_1900 [Pseudomonadota bacterium]
MAAPIGGTILAVTTVKAMARLMAIDTVTVAGRADGAGLVLTG